MGNSFGKIGEYPKRIIKYWHDVRVEMSKVNWPSRDDVVSTTGIVIATVFFFGVFLAAVDWLVQRGVQYIFKAFGV